LADLGFAIECHFSDAIIVDFTSPSIAMPPRLRLFSARSVAFRTQPLVRQKRFAPLILQQRAASDDATKGPATTPVDPKIKGPNMDPLPHVTEEQAAIDKSMGVAPPDVEQGTPVLEVSFVQPGPFGRRACLKESGITRLTCSARGRFSSEIKMHKTKHRRS